MKKSQLLELIKNVVREEQDYQQLFKHMLDKVGKSITDMSDEQKKKFFNAVDTAYKAKSEGKLRGYNEAELTAGQKKIDTDGDGEIEGSDLAALRAGKKVEEENPGLWANIRAKKARGEEPAHGNSDAHKDAVKAGKEINKNESVNEGKFEPNFAKKIEAILKRELGVNKLEVTGPRTGRVMNRQSYYFHIPNPTHWVVVQKSQYGGPYPDDYYVALTNSLGQEKEETVVDHITDENVVLKTVSALAKKYKKQLTDTRMKESVKEKK